MSYPLPPTTNILPLEERSRLVRSSRKLGSVLGVTPYLVENDSSFKMLPIGKTTSRALKRQGSIFTHHHQISSLSVTSISSTSSHHPSSSSSSFILPGQCPSPGTQSPDLSPMDPPGLSLTRRRRPGGKAPPLCLRLNTVPFPPEEDFLHLSLSPSPLSSCPTTPVTPTVPDEAEIRRKRMAKLTRHLGEHVPADIVFPSDSVPKPTPLSHKRRSRSVHGIRAESVPVGDKKSHPDLKQEWTGEWNRSSIRDVQKELRNLRIR